jgi:hypothetical protein
MHTKIAFGFLAAALLTFAHAAIAAPGDGALCTRQAVVAATPLRKLQLAECEFYPCRCRRVCVIYQGPKCIETTETCDICSKC